MEVSSIEAKVVHLCYIIVTTFSSMVSIQSFTKIHGSLGLDVGTIIRNSRKLERHLDRSQMCN
jgi:hypothetical protein